MDEDRKLYLVREYEDTKLVLPVYHEVQFRDRQSRRFLHSSWLVRIHPTNSSLVIVTRIAPNRPVHTYSKGTWASVHLIGVHDGRAIEPAHDELYYLTDQEKRNLENDFHQSQGR